MTDAIPFKLAPGLLDLLRGEAQDNYAAATPPTPAAGAFTDGWDRDTLLPFARKVENGHPVRGGGIFGSDWHLATPQVGVDMLNAIKGVGNASLTAPYNPEHRDEMIEGAGAWVGPQIAAGFGRALRAPAGSVELGSAGGNLPGIRAYHASPYDFEQFSSKHIGTGEGAQAYGHGLYFAEKEGVAREYKKKLSPRNASEAAAQDLAESHGRSWSDMGVYERQSYIDQAEKSGISSRRKPNGRMYEVRINADPEHFLDWDKPLSQQSEKIQQLYNERVAPSLKTREIGVNPNLGPLTDVMHPEGGSLGAFTKDNLADVLSSPSKYAPTKGSDFYDSIARKSVNGDWGAPGDFARAQAAQVLREAGIPGIRYLDQGSRNMDPRIAAQERHVAFLEKQPNVDASKLSEARAHLDKLRSEEGRTRNYVVFDDKLIDILRKYGLSGLMAGGAMSQSSGKDN